MSSSLSSQKSTREDLLIFLTFYTFDIHYVFLSEAINLLSKNNTLTEKKNRVLETNSDHFISTSLQPDLNVEDLWNFKLWILKIKSKFQSIRLQRLWCLYKCNWVRGVRTFPAVFLLRRLLSHSIFPPPGFKMLQLYPCKSKFLFI